MKIEIDDNKTIYEFTSANNYKYLVEITKDKNDRNGNKKYKLDFFYKAIADNSIHFGSVKVFSHNTTYNEIKRILNIAIEELNKKHNYNLEKVEEEGGATTCLF